MIDRILEFLQKFVKYLMDWLSFFQEDTFLPYSVGGMDSFLDIIAWGFVLRVGTLLGSSIMLCILLDYLNDKIISASHKKRIKRHQLTITNNGNTPSMFMLRSIDNPRTMGMRFYAGEEPLIWVTYAPKENQTKKTEQEQLLEQERAKPVKSGQPNDLVPNLNDPLGTKPKAPTLNEASRAVTNEINKVGKQAGFFASILSSILSLLPGNNSQIQQAQNAMKSIQQDITQTSAAITTKTNTINTLGGQLDQLPGTDQIKSGIGNLTDQVSNMSVSDLAAAMGNPDSNGSESYGSLIPGDYNYDEEVWKKNIGKYDENNGAYIFGQTGILQPGESIKIGVELCNLSENNQKVSHMYKIEVRQLLVSDLHLSAPHRYVNGIVIFDKLSVLSRVGPSVVMVFLMAIAIQLVAILSILLF